MKILVYDTNIADENGSRQLGDAQLYPDSAVIINRKPLFVPNWGQPFVTQVALGARICRLGKHIAPRFAHRYWNAATVMLVTSSEKESGDMARCFDGAIAMGDWMEVAADSRCELNVTLSSDTEKWLLPPHSATIASLIDEAIVTASRFMTIKMGDIIAVKLGGAHPIEIGDVLYGRINDEMLISIKIK